MKALYRYDIPSGTHVDNLRVCLPAGDSWQSYSQWMMAINSRTNKRPLLRTEKDIQFYKIKINEDCQLKYSWGM